MPGNNKNMETAAAKNWGSFRYRRKEGYLWGKKSGQQSEENGNETSISISYACLF